MYFYQAVSFRKVILRDIAGEEDMKFGFLWHFVADFNEWVYHDLLESNRSVAQKKDLGLCGEYTDEGWSIFHLFFFAFKPMH